MMKIQYLNGGLANQVFQYIFYRYAQINHPEEQWFLDDSFFFVQKAHNGYELEKVFGITSDLLSRTLDKDVWQELIENKKRGISIPQSFKDLGFPMIMITEFSNYREHNPFDGEVYQITGNAFLPEIIDLKVDYVYYHGYWLHRGWYDACKDILRKELVFPEITDSVNLGYADRIQGTESIAVHVRRGDYVKIGWASQNVYYEKSISRIVEECPDTELFVFSDDINWCKENEEGLGFRQAKHITYVEGNTDGKNYVDLQLMSMCKFMVIGKSAFGYLAMLLNDQLKWCISDQ